MNVNLEASISERLKEAMELRQVKQVDLVNATGIDKGSISQYISGKYSPKGDKLYKLARVLNVSSAWLAGFNVPMNDDETQTIKSNATLIDGIIFYNTPLYENVSAGFGTMAIDSIVGYVPLPFNSKSEAEETICIKVTGDSMSPKIENGDIIQVRKQTSVDSGDIAVVLLDGSEGLVKRVEYGSDYIKLISLNLNYPPITLIGESVTRVMVVGKVKKIIRDI